MSERGWRGSGNKVRQRAKRARKRIIVIAACNAGDKKSPTQTNKIARNTRDSTSSAQYRNAPNYALLGFTKSIERQTSSILLHEVSLSLLLLIILLLPVLCIEVGCVDPFGHPRACLNQSRRNGIDKIV
jgi:hypothetical protein